MRAVAIILLFESIIGTVLFACAGRLDLPWFWALLGIHAAGMSLSVRLMDPELRKERTNLRRRAGEDRSLRAMLIPFILVHLAVAALDAGRFGWSGNVPTWVHALGLVGYCGGFALSAWAMIV